MITTIDKLLKKNSYLKNLSVADRIAVYNEALKQVAELRHYFYSNQESETNFFINLHRRLSAVDTMDSVLIDDMYDLTLEERLLIYDMTVSRIGSLRNLQDSYHYLISNNRETISNLSTLSFPILSSIQEFVYNIKEKILQLPILCSMRNYVNYLSERTLSLPIQSRIIAGLLSNKTLNLPISAMIGLFLPAIEKIKTLALPIQLQLNSFHLSIKNLYLPIQATLTAISASLTSEKTLALPMSATLTSIPTYNILNEHTYLLPISASIHTI